MILVREEWVGIFWLAGRLLSAFIQDFSDSMSSDVVDKCRRSMNDFLRTPPLCDSHDVKAQYLTHIWQ